MKFKITSAGNHSTVGELFFSLPAQKTTDAVAKDITVLCRMKAENLYGDMTFISPRLETELDMMKKTNTAFHFALLKEIEMLSSEFGYPVQVQGSVSGSIIAYLLGITSINPLPPHYRCESPGCHHCEVSEGQRIGIDMPDKLCPVCGKKMTKDGYELPAGFVWGTFDDPRMPDFSIGIAEAVRPMIHDILNKKFYASDSDKSAYRMITMPNSHYCEIIGKMVNLTEKFPPTLDELSDEVYLRVLNNIADDYTKMYDHFILNHNGYDQDVYFAQYIRAIGRCDFYTLIRLYGYIYGSLSEPKAIDHVYDTDFFVLRDEFYRALVSCGIPDDIALDITEYGGRWDRKAEYNAILEAHRVPQTIKDYFSSLGIMLSASDCISRLELMFIATWFQINYPEEYNSLQYSQI